MSSPVISNTYIEYFEEMALGSNFPYLAHGGRDADDVSSILKKNQLKTFFNHLNSVDPHS